MALGTDNMFGNRECAEAAFKNRAEAIALYRYRRKGQSDYAYVVCYSQDDINDILNSKFVDQKTTEKLMGL